jgi:hypothetical protein
MSDRPNALPWYRKPDARYGPTNFLLDAAAKFVGQPLYDAYKGIGQAAGFEQDPNAPKGYVSQDALNRAANGIAAGQLMGSGFARAPAGALRSGAAGSELDMSQAARMQRAREIEQVWGPKWDILMGREYRIAEAAGDLSTMYDILAAKLSKASSIDPEMRPAMERTVWDLYHEMGPEGRARAGIEENAAFDPAKSSSRNLIAADPLAGAMVPTYPQPQRRNQLPMTF